MHVSELEQALLEVDSVTVTSLITSSGEQKDAMADDAMYSIVDNLISNSITHAEGTKIEISLLENDGKAIIRIADNGKGIPDEIKDNIFEESFKYGKTGNTGLGLYIVMKTVERYEGKITVEDNKPKGVVFMIELNSFVD